MAEAGQNPQIKLLIWMLEDIRKVTLSGVNHLSREQLFKNPIDGEFPVGAFLMHLCECDISWLEIISGIEQSEDLKKRSYYDKWFDPSVESAAPKEPLEISEYLETLEITRKNFLEYVSEMKDSELEEKIVMKRKSGDVEILKKWIIYHIIEHEAHTRGQMFMLIRMAGWNKV
ncbi:MAG TPA: DinB family protein [Ignavibacteria bacterium]|nr:DinB family protein [Ignavibacteria bacterium]